MELVSPSLSVLDPAPVVGGDDASAAALRLDRDSDPTLHLGLLPDLNGQEHVPHPHVHVQIHAHYRRRPQHRSRC
jgi:hypothetical protein